MPTFLEYATAYNRHLCGFAYGFLKLPSSHLPPVQLCRMIEGTPQSRRIGSMKEIAGERVDLVEGHFFGRSTFQ